jgi:RNase P/RNase MRP subunit POP5
VSDAPYLTPDDIDRLKSRDTRFAALHLAIELEHELKNSLAVRSIMAAVRADADAAMETLATVSPADQHAVALHLVQVSTLVYIRRVLDRILRAGSAAEEAIRSEDQAHGGE